MYLVLKPATMIISAEYYDQHNIRILNLDDDGNISFVVYGYMNCGVMKAELVPPL